MQTDKIRNWNASAFSNFRAGQSSGFYVSLILCSLLSPFSGSEKHEIGHYWKKKKLQEGLRLNGYGY